MTIVGQKAKPNDKVGRPRKAKAPLLKLDPSMNLTNGAYLALRNAIEQGKIPPGKKVREIEIAGQLGISRTPVCAAIRRLVSEGFLTALSARNIVLAELNEDDILELYDMMEVVEGAAAEFAADRATEADKQKLIQLVEGEADILDDISKVIEFNTQLHNTIYSAAQNRYLTKSVRTISVSLNVLRGSTFSEPGRAVTSHHEHVQLVSAIRQRDRELAGKIARQHIREARRIRMAQFFSKN
jgi:DNA-binding GntR family transcriptional regulator